MSQPASSPRWLPFHEPIEPTLLRTALLALALGTAITVASGHRVSWPVGVALALWPSYGGHLIEIWFLNWLRPRIAPDRRVQLPARLAVWSAGGVALALLMHAT